MPRIFSETDVRIGLVLVAICMIFVIIGSLIWGVHPPRIGVVPLP